jgi:hypothetical protein
MKMNLYIYTRILYWPKKEQFISPQLQCYSSVCNCFKIDLSSECDFILNVVITKTRNKSFYFKTHFRLLKINIG